MGMFDFIQEIRLRFNSANAQWLFDDFIKNDKFTKYVCVEFYPDDKHIEARYEIPLHRIDSFKNKIRMFNKCADLFGRRECCIKIVT